MGSRFPILTLIFALITSTALEAAKSAPEAELIYFKQLAASGQLQEASNGVSRLVAKYPDDLQVKLLHAALVGDTGNLDLSAALFGELIDNYPALPEPVTGLATVQARQGQLMEAYKTLLAGVKAFPGDGLMHENLAEMYTIFATMEYRKVLAMGQGSEDVKVKLKHLGEVLSDKRGSADVELPVVAEADFRSVPVTIEDSGACRAVGPFRDGTEFKRAAVWLSAQNILSSKVMHKLREVTYLVYLPPVDSYVAAAALREKLTKQGIEDTAVIRSGSLKHAVSLGVYRQPESVQRRMAQLAHNDYQAESIKRSRLREWLWHRLGKAAVISNAELLAGLPGNDLQVRKTACD